MEQDEQKFFGLTLDLYVVSKHYRGTASFSMKLVNIFNFDLGRNYWCTLYNSIKNVLGSSG